VPDGGESGGECDVGEGVGNERGRGEGKGIFIGFLELGSRVGVLDWGPWISGIDWYLLLGVRAR